MGRRILLVLALLLLPSLAHAQIHLVNRAGQQPPQHGNGFTPASIARMDKGLLQGYLDQGYRFVVSDPAYQKHIPQWALDYQNALDRPRAPVVRPVEQPKVPTPADLVTRDILPYLTNENPDRLLTGSEMKTLADAGYVTEGRDGVFWVRVPKKDGKIEKRVFVRKDGLVGYTQLPSPDLWEDEVAPLEKEGRFRDVSNGDSEKRWVRYDPVPFDCGGRWQMTVMKRDERRRGYVVEGDPLPATLDPRTAAEVRYYDARDIARLQTLEAGLTFTLHLIPGGAGTDYLVKGDYENAILSYAGDVAMIFTAGGSKALVVTGMVIEGGVITYRGYEVVRDVRNGKWENVPGNVGEIVLRSAGLPVNFKHLKNLPKGVKLDPKLTREIAEAEAKALRGQADELAKNLPPPPKGTNKAPAPKVDAADPADLYHAADKVPMHTGARNEQVPKPAELKKLIEENGGYPKRANYPNEDAYQLARRQAESEAAAVWYLRNTPSTSEVVTGEKAARELLGVPDGKIVDHVRVRRDGMIVPTEVKDTKEFALMGGADTNSAILKFKNIGQSDKAHLIDHFEVIGNIGTKLPNNYRVDVTGVLWHFSDGKWGKVLIPVKGGCSREVWLRRAPLTPKTPSPNATIGMTEMLDTINLLAGRTPPEGLNVPRGIDTRGVAITYDTRPFGGGQIR